MNRSDYPLPRSSAHVQNEVSHTRSAGPLRNRSFLHYLGQSGLSRLASSVWAVCLVWFVFAETGSAIAVGVVSISETLAVIAVGLPAGHLVDRYSRRGLMLTSHLIRAGGLLVLAFLAGAFGYQLGFVLVVVVALSAATELNRSVAHALLPDVVEPSDLADANGLENSLSSSLAAVASAAGGGLIVLVGVDWGFGFAALAYAFAAVLTYVGVHPRAGFDHPSARGALAHDGFLASIRAGVRYLVSQAGLLQLSLSAMVFNFVFYLTWSFLVIYVTEGLSQGSLALGLLLAVYAAGTMVGNLVVGRTSALRNAGRIWVLGYGFVGGFLLLLLGAFPYLPLALADLVLMGLSLGFAGNVWLTSAQNLVPTEMRGRYFALDGLLSWIAGPPAIALGAVLIALWGVDATFRYAGIAMAVAAALFLLPRSLRRLDGRVQDPLPRSPRPDGAPSSPM